MESSEKKKSSLSILSVLLLLFVIMITAVSLYSALGLYVAGAGMDQILLNLITGGLGLVIIFSISAQLLRRYRTVKSTEEKMVITVEECDGCKFKAIRKFERGDFIFKKTEKGCPKCDSLLTITAIYRRS